MIIDQIATGASVPEAVEAAKMLLAAPDDVELHQEILELPKKKLFKSIPAKVRVWYEVPDEKPAAAESVSAPVKSEPKKASFEKKPAPVQKKPAVERKPFQPEKKAAPTAAEPVKEEAAEKPAAPAPVAPTETRVPFEIDENDKTVQLLRLIVKGMNIEQCDIKGEKVEETGEIIYNVSCGDADGALIGRRGETLDSIQYLLRLSLNKGVDDDKHRKVSVNVGNYREKRNENLRALAAKSARQVLKYGRNAVLDPMNPYERRIIHTAIQGIEGVTSHSVGSDGNRKVVISLAEGVQPTHPSRGGYNNRGKGGFNKGGYNNNRGGRGNGRGGYQKREPYKPSVTREPRKDSAGSLYGRIDIPKKTEE